jgi:hypothetical protein
MTKRQLIRALRDCPGGMDERVDIFHDDNGLQTYYDIKEIEVCVNGAETASTVIRVGELRSVG